MYLILTTFFIATFAFYDFIPDDLTTFTINANNAESFYENITETTIIRGAYQVNHHKDSIDFFIKSPTGRTIFSKLSINRGNFSVQANEIGLYEIKFVNKKKGNILLTFAIDVKKDNDQVKSSDFDPLEEDITTIYIGLKELYYDYKFQQIRYETSTQQIKDANKRILIFTIIETTFIILVTIWQIWYIKRLYNKRQTSLF